jgi:hypothetical protein
MKVAPQLLEISRQLNARYTANLVPNAGHTHQLSLCDQWSRTYKKYLQLRIYMLQYSMERICAAIGDNRTFRSPFYCKFGAKYSAHHPVYPMWTAVPGIYNVITAPHIQCINIQLNVSALLMDMSRKFHESYTAIWVPNTAHILQFTQCVLWSRTYTKYLQLLIFRPQYSTERICAAIGDMATIQCGLYYKLCAKYSAHPPVYAV